MKDSKFKPGQFVLYKTKNEIVQISSVFLFEQTRRRALKQDGIFGPPSGEEYTEKSYRYSIFAHTGDTASICDEYLLQEIPNAYAFNISRRLASNKMDPIDKNAQLVPLYQQLVKQLLGTNNAKRIDALQERIKALEEL